MNLAKAIENDLMERVSDASLKEPLNRVAEMYKKDTEEMSRTSSNPDGTPRAELSPRYADYKQGKGGSRKPDLYFTGKAQNSFDYYRNGKEINYVFRDGEAKDYMADHGLGEGGMKQRRYFPNEKDPKVGYNDINSSPQQENVRKVEDILEAHFNQDRTIRVKG